MKHYVIAAEHGSHFVIHDKRDGKRFPIAKAGLSKLTLGQIGQLQRFDEGGEVAPGEEELLSRVGQISDAADDGAPLEVASAYDPSADVIAQGNDHEEAPPAPDLPATSPPDAIPGAQMEPPPSSGPTPTNMASLEPQLLGRVQQGFAASDTAARNIGAATTGLRKAIGAQGSAAQAHAAAVEKAEQSNNVRLAAAQAEYEKIHAERQAEVLKTYEASQQKIDPSRWFATRNTGQKVAAFIAAIAGGFNAGIRGGPNQGLAFIEKQIDDDIATQKANVAQANERYGQASGLLKQTDADFEMKKSHMLAGLAGQLRVASAHAAGPEAAARAEELANEALIKSQESAQRSAQADTSHALATLGHIEGVRGRQQAGSIAKGAREDAQTDKDFQKLDGILSPERMRSGAAGDAVKRLWGSERLKTLLTDPAGAAANLTSSQMQEAASALQSLISPGGHSEHEVAALVPSSARGNAAKVIQWLSNEPTGTNQQAFVRQMLQTAHREEATVRDQVEGAMVRSLPTFSQLKRKDPERYRALLEAKGLSEAVDEQGKYVPVRNRPSYAEPQQAAPHGDSVIQNGITYRWNPSTSHYDPVR